MWVHYRMISRSATGRLQDDTGDILYRISNPLGEYVLEQAKAETTPLARVTFQVTGHPTRIMVLEKLKEKSGWLTLTRLRINSLGEEEHLLFSGFQDEGESLDQETLRRIFSLSAKVNPLDSLPPPILRRLSTDASLTVQAQLEKTLQANTTQFNEEQDRLERWAEDRKTSSRTQVDEIEVQLKDIRRAWAPGDKPGGEARPQGEGKGTNGTAEEGSSRGLRCLRRRQSRVGILPRWPAKTAPAVGIH